MNYKILVLLFILILGSCIRSDEYVIGSCPNSLFTNESFKEVCVFEDHLCIEIPEDWHIMINEAQNNVAYSDTVIGIDEVLVTSVSEFIYEEVSLEDFFEKNLNSIIDDPSIKVEEFGSCVIQGESGRYLLAQHKDNPDYPLTSFSIFMKRHDRFYIIDLSYLGKDLERNRFCEGEKLIGRFKWNR